MSSVEGSNPRPIPPPERENTEVELLIEAFNAEPNSPNQEQSRHAQQAYWQRRVAVLRRESARVSTLDDTLESARLELESTQRNLESTQRDLESARREAALIGEESSKLAASLRTELARLQEAVRTADAQMRELAQQRDAARHAEYLNAEAARRAEDELRGYRQHAANLEELLKSLQARHEQVERNLVEMTGSRAWRMTQVCSRAVRRVLSSFRTVPRKAP